jgi:hypothetical protein
MTLRWNWTSRCTARWMVIAGIVLALGSLLLAVRANASPLTLAAASSPPTTGNGLGTSPSKPNGRLVMALAVAQVDVGEPADGLGTSPSDPVVPANSTWLATMAVWVVAGCMALRKAAPTLFKSDLWGFGMALVASQIGAMAEALSRGEPPSWALAKQGLVLGVLAAGGYTMVVKRLLKPLGSQVLDKLGWPNPLKGQA